MTLCQLLPCGSAALSVVLLTACPLPPEPTVATFKSVWITASWSGGRTGTPLNSRAVSPTTYVGSLCPAAALLLENHTTRYAAFPFGDILIITNNCTSFIYEVAVCRTAGSGGVASALPLCAVDPRETLASHLDIQRIGSGSHQPYGTTPIDLDISIFYCSQGSHLNLGQIPGKSPTDCVED